MAITVLTKKYAESVYRLPLDKMGQAYLRCKPLLASKVTELSAKALAEAGYDAQLAANKAIYEQLAYSVVGWAGLEDVCGVAIEYSKEMLAEICEADPAFAEQQMARIRHIAREAKLEEQKN